MTYMFKNKIIISLLLTVFFIGCGYKQSSTQIRDVAFLKFNKSWLKSYTVVVNEKYKFQLDACVERDKGVPCYDGTENQVYEITSGNTFIKVFDKDNNIIMNKEMYIGSSNTMEVDLP